MDRGGLVKRDLNADFVKRDSIITHFTLPPVPNTHHAAVQHYS